MANGSWSQRNRLVDIILVVVYLNQVLACHFGTPVDINVATLLISGKNESMVHLKFNGILDDVSKMLTTLHVILTTVEVVADVRYLLVLAQLVILYSLLIIIIVLVVIVIHDVVGVFLS